MKAQRANVPDNPKAFGADLWAACDDEALYVACKVKDATPAVNLIEPLKMYWNGDCLELLFSAGKGERTGTKDWLTDDLMISVGVDGRQGARVHTKKVEVGGPGITRAFLAEHSQVCVRTWKAGDGYDLEVKIPWRSIHYAPPKLGDMFMWEWDIMYGKADSWWRKMVWTQPHTGGVNPGNRNNWELTRVVALGAEHTVYPEVLAQSPSFTNPHTWPRTRQITVRESEDTENVYKLDVYLGTSGDSLYLRCEVLDPDPATNTATVHAWWESGDAIDLYIDGRRICLPAVPRTKQACFASGGLKAIDGSRVQVTVTPAGKAYRLLAKLPLSAIGGRKRLDKGVPFNIRMGWSDITGGSIWRRVFWIGKTTQDHGTLRIKHR